MQFQCYSKWVQLPDSANALFAESAQSSLFYSRSWFENLTAHALRKDQSMLLACVQQGERVLAVLPLMQCPNRSLRALGNHYTTRYSLLLLRGPRQTTVLDCMAAGLIRLDFQVLRLDPVDENDQAINRLRQALQAKGLPSQRYFRLYNWVHRLKTQSFDQYMANRPSSLRNTIARKKRKLVREQGHTIRLYQDKALDQALADYFQVYNASWKTNELCANFKPALVKDLALLGWLRLGILYINQQPIAAQIWFVLHGKANIFRLVYDPAWQQYSPGSILTHHMMQHVIDTDKVAEIDFLTGNERYKQDWMTECRALYGWHFVHQDKRRALLSRLTRALEFR